MMPSVKNTLPFFSRKGRSRVFLCGASLVCMSYQLKLYVCVVDEPSTLTVTSWSPAVDCTVTAMLP